MQAYFLMLPCRNFHTIWKGCINSHYSHLTSTPIPHNPLHTLRGEACAPQSPRPVQWWFMCGTPTYETYGSCDVLVWVLLHLTPQLSSMVQSHILTSNMFGSVALLRYATTASLPLLVARSRGVLWWKWNNKDNKATQLQQSDWHLGKVVYS